MAGIKGYNGVAILSKRPFAGCGVRDWCDKTDARHAIVSFRGGIELHSYCVSAGNVRTRMNRDMI
jgi:exodeoxyribonuclease-3